MPLAPFAKKWYPFASCLSQNTSHGCGPQSGRETRLHGTGGGDPLSHRHPGLAAVRSLDAFGVAVPRIPGKPAGVGGPLRSLFTTGMRLHAAATLTRPPHGRPPATLGGQAGGGSRSPTVSRGPRVPHSDRSPWHHSSHGLGTRKGWASSRHLSDPPGTRTVGNQVGVGVAPPPADAVAPQAIGHRGLRLREAAGPRRGVRSAVAELVVYSQPPATARGQGRCATVRTSHRDHTVTRIRHDTLSPTACSHWEAPGGPTGTPRRTIPCP